MAQAPTGFTLTTESSPPQRQADGSWQFNMWAIAQQRGRDRPPASDIRLEFYVDGDRYAEEATGSDGRTPAVPVTVPVGKTAVAIEAQTVGDATRRSKRTVTLEVVRKKPKQITYVNSLKGTRHRVDLTVFDEDGNPARGEYVFVEDYTHSSPVQRIRKPTNEYGQVAFSRMFTGRRKQIIVRVRDIRKMISLVQEPSPITPGRVIGTDMYWL